MRTSAVIPFFALVFVLSVPFWVAGALLGDLPGSPMNLPVGALQFPCPLIAAAILLHRREGAGAVRRLLRTTFAAGGMRRAPWLVTAFLLAPVIDLAAYALALLVGGPLGGEHSPLLAAPLLFAVFFVAAACEEAGWMGYAAGPLLDRRGVLGTGLIIGVVWGAWHVMPLLQAGRSPAWIAWWFLGTVAARVIIVWLYAGTGGSVPAAVVVHAMLNVMPSLLPGYTAGDTLIACSGLIGALVAVALLVWSAGPASSRTPRPARRA
ncbi:CPBP family intramembrane glutamic endopeptidase [Nonomuraea sp. NPDC052634]|uniref:CPBP family intramembrane glutamic endopeptidase n=1 Tax=Nonomuraea sp. NPDC052634 TaxID=3155813 RepID=UPI00341B88CC